VNNLPFVDLGERGFVVGDELPVGPGNPDAVFGYYRLLGVALQTQA